MKTMFFAILGFITVGSFSASAKELRCNISNVKDAQLCMNEVALKHVEYNLPNIGSASTQKNLLRKVLNTLGKKLHPSLEDADYVGVMLEKGDEWNLYYYALKKGRTQQVVSIGDINLVDLNDKPDTQLTVSDLILGDKNKKFGTEDRAWIEEYISQK